MTGAVLTLSGGRTRQTVTLGAHVDPALEERAQREAIGWIKSLRSADVDGVPLRRRFTHRGDSLWWFTEIYLHKQQVILTLFRALAAVEDLITREAPTAIAIDRADRITASVAARVAAARGVALTTAAGHDQPRVRLAALHARARWLHLSALASRVRTRARRPGGRPLVAAFVHRAFWRNAPGTPGGIDKGGGTNPDGSAEAYIGPVLEALERRLDPGGLSFVSLGPAENFSARRWWHPLSPAAAAAVPSIEAFAPLEALKESRTVWAERRTHLRALMGSGALREAAVIRGCDCWPIVREELAGAALLQWPWSARAMDEAGATLDALEPAAAVTYAEAGGWGRALVLECRRRGIGTAGLQHGFIYRHWLNYLHEADEMARDPGNADDAGFPRPDRTLLFDEYAKHHLIEHGRFPPDSLTVTGSPRLDALVQADRSLTADEIAAARVAGGASEAALVLVVTKHREAGRVLGPLVEAAAALPGVHLAIKTHPAETPDVYRDIASGRTHVTVLPASAPLAPLLRASRAVVTVSSTVALDAAVLGIPALVVGLPTNLSPFVDAGVMAGAGDEGLDASLRQILYDEGFRLKLEGNRRAFLSRFGIGSDGRAAERTADAVLQLSGPRSRSPNDD